LQSLKPEGETSAQVRKRVGQLREMQTSRQGKLNARLTHQELSVLGESPEMLNLVNQWVDRYGLSMRSWLKLRRLARSLADRQGEACVQVVHLKQVFAFRSQTGESV
jgi:magnesium chelatase family protein